MGDELPEDMVIEEIKDSLSSEEMYSAGATHLGKSGGDLWDLVGTLRVCEGSQRLTLIKTHFPKDPRRQRLALEWYKILMERYPDHQKGEDTDFGGAGNHPPSPSPSYDAPPSFQPPSGGNPMVSSLQSEAISEEDSYNKASQALGVGMAKCRELIELVKMLETSGIPGALESVCTENFPRDHVKQEAFARLFNELSFGVTLGMSTLGAPPASPASGPPSPAPPPSDAPPSPYEPPSPAGGETHGDGGDTASKLGISESRLKELVGSARELVSAGMNDGVAVVAEENWRGDYEKQATFSFYCSDAGVKP